MAAMATQRHRLPRRWESHSLWVKIFQTADKGKTFKRGGDMAKANPFMEMIAKKKAMAKGKKEMPMKKMAKGGMAYAKGGGIESKGKTKGKMITMKSGGKMC
jgi:hypothetical protein